MTLILSRMQALAGTAAVLGLLAVVPARTQALRPDVIHIEHWPEDVPCRVLKHYPDGNWEITVPYELSYSVHQSSKFKDPAVADYWGRKCRGRRDDVRLNGPAMTAKNVGQSPTLW